MLAELPGGRGHGRARGPVDINERPAGPLHPPRGGPVAASAAPDRGATAVAVSAADQRGRLAGGRGGAGRAGVGGVRPRAARWLGGLHAPGLEALWQGLANVGSWWTLMVLWIGLVLALVVLRRWRHLIVWLVAWQLGGLVTDAVVGRTAQRARPFGVDLRTSWGGWAMPSLQITVLTAILMAVLYTLVPEGRWRNTGKWVAAGLVALVGVARVALGTDT